MLNRLVSFGKQFYKMLSLFFNCDFIVQGVPGNMTVGEYCDFIVQGVPGNMTVGE